MHTKRHFSIHPMPRRRGKWRFFPVLLALLLALPLLMVDQGNVAYGQDPLKLTFGGSSATTIQYMTNKDTVILAPNLTLTGGSADAKIGQAKVFLSGKFNPAEDKLGWNGQAGGTITANYDEANGVLTLRGEDTAANYQAALRLVTYTYTNQNSPKPADRTIEFAIGSTLYNPQNGHFYDFVASNGITWEAAKAEAETKTHEGRKGYLATITSAEENAFVAGKLKGNGWMGATDAGHDKQWKWVTGPEAITTFFYQKGYNASGANTCGNGRAADQPPGNHYANWANNEPNDANTPESSLGTGCAGEEDYAHFFKNGTWNDYPNDPNAIAESGSNNFWQVDGYVIEYGGMPGDSPTEPLLTGTVTISYVKCRSCGDVHIFTPDGLRYDFQATGEFLAVQSGDGTVVVQARQEAWPRNPKVSVNTAVAFMVGSDKVEIYLKPQAALYVNDTETAFPAESLTLPGGGRLDHDGGSASRPEFWITWPGGNFAAWVKLYTDATYLDYGVAGHGNTYEGLLGNLDGNPLNDLQIRGGDQIKPPPSVADLNRFGDSWRVPSAGSASLFRDTEAAKQPHTLVVIEDEKKAEAEKICQNGGIANELALKNCVYDVALTDDPVFVESAKEVEESVENIPASTVVPATPGEALGGAIFDADQAGAADIAILNGDDLIITTGAGYIRFNIYRNGEFVVSYSVGTNTSVANAFAQTIATAMPTNDPTSTVCFDAVQGKIAWNYDGTTRWDPTNVTNLCRDAESFVEPAQGFAQVMHNGIDHGGSTRWEWPAASKLCQGTQNATSTVQCFVSAIESGKNQSEAIDSCRR